MTTTAVKPPRPGKFTGTPRASEIHPETGLSFPQIRCLRAVRFLTRAGNRTGQRQVAEKLGVWRRAAETVLSGLKERGLVDWTPIRERKGHCRLCGGPLSIASVHLTETGKATLATISVRVAMLPGRRVTQ